MNRNADRDVCLISFLFRFICCFLPSFSVVFLFLFALLLFSWSNRGVLDDLSTLSTVELKQFATIR
jgi:hypothetical protein